MNLPFKIDTGADANVLTLRKLNEISPYSKIHPTSVTLNGFGGGKVEAIGETVLKCSHGNKTSLNLRLIIVDCETVPILGLNAIMNLGIIKRENNLCHKNIATQQQV